MRKLLLSFGLAALAATAMQAETVYFQDDFEWLEPWTTAAGVCDWVNSSETVAAESKQLSTSANDSTAYEALVARGYAIVQATHSSKTERTPDKVVYLQKNYLKFGLTGYHAGLVLPSISNIPTGASARISFKWAPMRQGKPGAEGRGIDPSELVVVIANGEQEAKLAVPAHTFVAGDNLSWVNADIDLAGQTITADTKITIRQIDDQWPYKASDETTSATARYFLDDIKVYEAGSSSIESAVADVNAPVEYFNLQGVRVANPTAGIYVKRQGNTATKVLVK